MAELKLMKIGVMKTTGRVYDPLDLISPFSVRAKRHLEVKTWLGWCFTIRLSKNISG